jgi:serine/threonine protein kinase
MVLAQIDHPNVVRVLTRGILKDPGRTPYYLMELVAGHTLGHILRYAKEIRFLTAVKLSAQLASGLAEVHQRGLIHRDVKPENLVVSQDREGEVRLRLLDFGVILLLSDEDQGGFCGTFPYAAPEQIQGKRLGTAVDIFALGVVTFELFARKHPYAEYGGGEAGSLARADVTAPRLSDFGQFPPALVELVASMLDLDPSKRPPAEIIAERMVRIGRSAPSELIERDSTVEDLRLPDQVDQGPITQASLAYVTQPEAPAWLEEVLADFRAKELQRVKESGIDPYGVTNPAERPPRGRIIEKEAQRVEAIVAGSHDLRQAPTRDSYGRAILDALPARPRTDTQPTSGPRLGPTGTTPMVRVVMAPSPSPSPSPEKAEQPKVAPNRAMVPAATTPSGTPNAVLEYLQAQRRKRNERILQAVLVVLILGALGAYVWLLRGRS